MADDVNKKLGEATEQTNDALRAMEAAANHFRPNPRQQGTLTPADKTAVVGAADKLETAYTHIAGIDTGILRTSDTSLDPNSKAGRLDKVADMYTEAANRNAAEFGGHAYHDLNFMAENFHKMANSEALLEAATYEVKATNATPQNGSQNPDKGRKGGK